MLHKILGLPVGDLNGDSKRDIGASGGDGTYTVFVGTGDGTFKALPSMSALTPLIGVAIANTGVGTGPSLIVAAFAAWKIGVLPGNGDGTFGAPTFTNVNGQTATARLTWPHPTRTAAACPCSWATATARSARRQPMLWARRPMGIAVGELNLIGNLDLAVACMDATNTGGAIRVLRGKWTRGCIGQPLLSRVVARTGLIVLWTQAEFPKRASARHAARHADALSDIHNCRGHVAGSWNTQAPVPTQRSSRAASCTSAFAEGIVSRLRGGGEARRQMRNGKWRCWLRRVV